ncbi:MAG: hypothetical protein ACI9HK_002610 [Pirellulaceae bacterium]|jgi:hypothetical protein
MDLYSLGQPASFLWLKRFVERTGRVCIEIVHHHTVLAAVVVIYCLAVGCKKTMGNRKQGLTGLTPWISQISKDHWR